MTPSEYIKEAVRTNTQQKNVVASDILHAAMGFCTESGEFMDQLKRHIFYGTPFNWTNVKEEVGDKLWYIAILLNYMGMTFEEVMEANIHKLRVRYPEKFDSERAVNRDIAAEQKALE